jgi:hypothetical protein
MTLIKLTMVAPKTQISPLAIDQDRRVQNPMGGPAFGELKIGELKESDMVTKPVYVRHDQIHAVTTLNDPIPIAQAAVVVPCLGGVIFVAEDIQKVVRLVRTYGND